MKAVRTLVLAIVAGVIGFAGYRIFVHVRAPVLPAIVTTTMDAHRELSSEPVARIDRFIHDRSPVDRSASPRLVALTFDDGPYPVETPLLLDELRDLHVPATFFLIGRDAEQYPDLTRRISTEGHELGNHTATHPNLDQLSDAAVGHELDAGAEILERYARDPAIRTMMRPPHGRFTEATVRVAQRRGYEVILWNDDPGDWRVMTPAAIETHVMAHASAPDIVLLHSGSLATIEALPELVRRFHAGGFEFVTVGQLMKRAAILTIDHPARDPV